MTNCRKLIGCSMDDVMLPNEAQESSSKKTLFPSASVKKKKNARNLLEPKDDDEGL